MTYYIFSESAGQNLVNERYCNIPSISNASFGHERSGSLSPNGLFLLQLRHVEKFSTICEFQLLYGFRGTMTDNSLADQMIAISITVRMLGLVAFRDEKWGLQPTAPPVPIFPSPIPPPPPPPHPPTPPLLATQTPPTSGLSPTKQCEGSSTAHKNSHQSHETSTTLKQPSPSSSPFYGQATPMVKRERPPSTLPSGVTTLPTAQGEVQSQRQVTNTGYSGVI